jgi:homoserine/homoserine lactone efflux protein
MQPPSAGALQSVIPEHFPAFLLLTALISLMPGPNTMFVMSQSALRGHKAAILAGLGIQTANVAYFWLTALGLSALVATNTMVFNVLKYCGAAYLLAIGVWTFVRSFDKKQVGPEPAHAPKQSGRVGRTAFGSGLLIALGNPKTIIYFVMLLPQFIDAQRHVLGQTLVVSVSGTAIDIGAQTIYAFAGGALAQTLQQPRVRRWFERGLGSVFVGLSALAAFVKRAA